MRRAQLTKSNIYFAMLIVLIVTFVIVGALAERDIGSVAMIGRYSVQRAEFYLYLYEQKVMFEKNGGHDIWEMSFDGVSGENVAKQNALDSVTYVRMAMEYAKGEGISASSLDQRTAIENGEALHDMLLGALGQQKLTELGITRKLCEKTSEDGIIYNKVYTLITQNYVLSETDFESYFEEFYAANRSLILTNSQELQDRVREYYTVQKKSELFRQEYEKWMKSVEIKKNDKVWNEISVWDF